MPSAHSARAPPSDPPARACACCTQVHDVIDALAQSEDAAAPPPDLMTDEALEEVRRALGGLRRIFRSGQPPPPQTQRA